MKNMEEDTELASEMVGLLAKELRAAKRRIHELENQLPKDKELETELMVQRNEMSVVVTAREAVELGFTKTKESSEASPEVLTRIEELENNLAKYKEKYKAAREAKRELRHTLEEKEKILRQIEENQRSAVSNSRPKGISDEKQAGNEAGETGEADEEEKGLHNPDFMKFFSGLYSPAIRPNFNLLLPICQLTDDLGSYLASIALGSLRYFYFHKRVTWYSKHAIAFGPLEVVVKGQWVKSSEFSSLYGEIRELFSLSGSSIYYVGTYKCIQTQDWFPGGVPVPTGISIPAILDVAEVRNNGSTARRYRDGEVNLECVILQCIGFDLALYDKLLKAKKKETSVKLEPDSRLAKRAKYNA